MVNQKANNDMEQARLFRQAIMAQSTDNTIEQDKSSQENTKEKVSTGGLLRQGIIAAKNARNIKEKTEEEVKRKIMSPARQVTSRLLRQAWYCLIPSWGLTSVYINLHVFLRFVLGKDLFCKLGDEWFPKQIQNISGKAIGIIEAMVLLFINIIIAVIILIILSIIVFVVDSVKF